jgi:ankyrin repeat protein
MSTSGDGDTLERFHDSLCHDLTSPIARRQVTELRAMSTNDQVEQMAYYSRLDCGNLLRCGFSAGISANSLWHGRDEPLLCVAAKHGSCRAAAALLAGGADATLRDKHGWAPLTVASFYGRCAIMRQLVAAGAPLESKDEQGATPLIAASCEGRTEACALLLEAGASPSARNDGGGTSLFAASCNGRWQTIATLLDGGVELDGADACGVTPLHIASFQGHVEAVKHLLARGANASAESQHGRSPLTDSLMRSSVPGSARVQVLQTLLPISDVNHTTSAGETALHSAAKLGDLECFQLILPLVTNVDAPTVPGTSTLKPDKDSFNVTALHFAAHYGHHSMTKALLKRGASRMSRDSKGRTPLMWVAEQQEEHLSIVSLLLGKPGHENRLAPSDVNAAASNGWTALHFAAAAGKFDTCAMLIAAGADLEACTSKISSFDMACTPLNLAIFRHKTNRRLHCLLGGGSLAQAPTDCCAHCGASEAGQTAAGAAEESTDDTPVDTLLEVVRLMEANVQSGMSYQAAARSAANTATVSMMAQRDSFKPPPTLADGAKLRWCTGCLVVRYCSVECSRAAWPAHKLACVGAKEAREKAM